MRHASIGRLIAAMALLLAFPVAPATAFSATTHHQKHKAHAVTSHKAEAPKVTAHTSNIPKTRHSSPALKDAQRRGKPRKHHHVLSARAMARSRKFQRAFVASSQLRPMAQQLAQMRTPAAYAGVSAYAHSHSGEAASAAYLALGHAYLLDRNFPEAVSALRSAGTQGDALSDYSDYLTAQAYLQSGKLPQAEEILSGFDKKHPDSIFVASVPVLEANLFVQEGDPQSALRVLNAYRGEALANRADYLLALAKADQMAGREAESAQTLRKVYLDFPLSVEAAQARTLLGANASTALTPGERLHHADALYAASHYSDAGEEYRSLANEPAVSPELRNTLLVAAAACDWKLKRLDKSELERIPDSNDEAGARRLYLLMELARDKDDTEAQRGLVSQMQSRFPASPWLAEALYSSGNMYLLKKDFPTAIQYYSDLAQRFPKSCEPVRTAGCSNYAPSSHWRAAWLNYRLGNYSTAAQLFDEQIAKYMGGREIPSALYWRGRVYEDQEHRPDMAAAYYGAVARVYKHYYYAMLAEERLQQLGGALPVHLASLESMHPAEIPELTDDVPEDDPHVVKARLLANAGLNEYIAPEIHAAEGSAEWGAFAEAEIYASYGETWRAMRLLKRELPFYTSAPVEAIPVTYWRILFPQPYWNEIKADAGKNGLDPYMVASLIRQETEFNPGAISNKSAYGLMQLLPSVGRSMAKEEGLRHFQTNELLNPDTNIRLGTLYLKQTLDKFGGHPEYAFAAYNAGDDRVLDWQSVGNYHGMDEFVESIPFTETREYVQAILRNEAIYRELDKLQSQQASLAH